jgi:N-acetylated-alpha-linked acidic dipeptidase
MADAALLPFDFTALHKTVNGYIKELMTITDQLREETVVDQEAATFKAVQLAGNPLYNVQIKEAPTAVPFLDFSVLQNALKQLEISAQQLNDKKNKVQESEQKSAEINAALYQAEQQLLTTAGLPRRSWYKHTLYAPGFYTGYGVKTMPGIREAIEQRDWKEAQEQINVAAGAINKLANYFNTINK